MSTEAVLRALAAAAAGLLAGRPAGRVAPVFAGAAAAFAAFGAARAAFPSPAEAAASAFGIALLLALGSRRAFPCITEEALRAAAFLGGGAALVALASGRALGGVGPVALAALAVLAVSAFAAESARAGGEAGWREGVARTLSVAVPAALAAAFAAAYRSGDGAGRAWAVAVGLVGAVLVWAPAVLAERARVASELAEEVGIGLLPEEDAVVLRLPWTRSFEKRFGRADERREYVRSALLLAVVRHQQRRRSGEAERLRQLEVLTFRTRLRRTQEARAARFAGNESGDFPAPDRGAPPA